MKLAILISGDPRSLKINIKNIFKNIVQDHNADFYYLLIKKKK